MGRVTGERRIGTQRQVGPATGERAAREHQLVVGRPTAARRAWAGHYRSDRERGSLPMRREERGTETEGKADG